MSIVDTVLHKIFGTPHERKVKQLRPVIEQIHKAREALEALDDAALAAKSAEFREKLKNANIFNDYRNVSIFFYRMDSFKMLCN
mgnify:CR=1 FL=1